VLFALFVDVPLVTVFGVFTVLVFGVDEPWVLWLPVVEAEACGEPCVLAPFVVLPCVVLPCDVFACVVGP